MNIDFNQIVNQKLLQMEQDGVIQQKIESALEKSIMDAIDNQLGSWQFKDSLGKQLQEGVSSVAKDCGLAAYNTFITERVKVIVDQLASEDLGKKIEAAVDEILVQRYENVKLSDIFRRYREYVMNAVDERDKYDRQNFVSELDIRENGVFTHYNCRFSEYSEWEPGEVGNVEIHFCCYREDETEVAWLRIDGSNIENTLRLGTLTEFERYVTNLYFNHTKVVIDAEMVDQINDCSYVDY